MKNNTHIILFIVALTIVVIVLISFMIHIIQGKRHFDIKNISVDKVIDEHLEKTFQTISVDSDAALIEIKNVQEGPAQLIVYGDENRIQVNKGGNELEVNIRAKKCFGFCFNVKVAKVEIYLPKNYEGKLNLKNKYGDITVENLPSAIADIEAKCGDIGIESLKKIDITANYGDIDIGNAQEATIKADCGDVKIETLGRGKIDTSLGDIKISKVTEKVDIDESCGNINIGSLYINKNSTIRNSLGDIKIGDTNEIYIDAKTSLGDLEIENNYRHSEVTLKVTNSAGDIEVRN